MASLYDTEDTQPPTETLHVREKRRNTLRFVRDTLLNADTQRAGFSVLDVVAMQLTNPPTTSSATSVAGQTTPSGAGQVGLPLTPMAKLRAVLRQLTFNSRDIINDITRRAATLRGAEVQVASVVVAHAMLADPRHKLPCLYVIDSILKNVGGVYVPLFAADVADLFRECYPRVSPPDRDRFKKVLHLWRRYPAHGAVEQIFSDDVLFELESICKAIDSKQPIPPPDRFPLRAQLDYSTTALAHLTSLTAPPPNALKRPAEDQVHQRAAPHPAPVSHGSNANPIGRPTPVGAGIPHANREDVVHALVAQLEGCLSQTKSFVMLYPHAAPPGGFAEQIKTLETIHHLLQTTPPREIADDVLAAVSQQVIAFVNTNISFQQQNNIPMSPVTGAQSSSLLRHNNNGNNGDSVITPVSSHGVNVPLVSNELLLNPENALQLGIIDFTKESLCKARPGTVWLLYDALDIRCKQCGMRYKRDELGNRRMTMHLDFHFRQNRRAKSKSTGGATIGIIREWYINEDDWVEEEDDDDVLLKAGKTGGGDDDGTDGKNAADLFFEDANSSGVSRVNTALLDLDERQKLKEQVAARAKLGAQKPSEIANLASLDSSNSSTKEDPYDLSKLSAEKRGAVIEYGDIEISSSFQATKCNICTEPFTKVYDENKEAWILHGVVRTAEGVFHKSCYFDS